MGHGPGWYAFMQAQEDKERRQQEYEKRQREYARMKAQREVEREEWKREHLSTKKCPKCGGEMYIREGKYGKFLGCSNYPNCKGTLKI